MQKKFFLVVGYIKNFRPIIFKEYIKTYYDKDISDIQGVINANFTPNMKNNKISSINVDILIDKFKIINKIREKSIIFSTKNTIKSNIVFDKKDLIIDNFEFSGDKFKILMDGKIKKWGSKTPQADLNIDIDKARVEELYWFLPSNLFTSEKEILKIKKYGAYGDARGNLQLRGDLMLPEVYGEVDFTNVWVLDGLPADVPKAIIKTNYRKNIVDVDVKVWATPKEYVTVKGWSHFFDLSKNEYQINSTQNVPLGVAEKILVPVSDVIGFIIGPVPIMDIRGFGNIDLYTAGSKEKPYLKGQFRYNNASASFNDINLKLEKAYGGLDFDKDKIYFFTDRGFIWGQPASIKGVSDSKIDIDYKAEVKNAPVKEILNTLKTSPMIKNQVKQINLIDSADGIADLELNVLGKMEMKNIKQAFTDDIIKYFTPNGVLKIKNGKVSINNPKINLSNISGNVKFNLKNIEPDIDAIIYSSPIKIKGVISDKSDIEISSVQMKLADSIKAFMDMNFIKINDIDIKNISKSNIFKLDLKYKGDTENLEFDKINLKAQFQQKTSSNAMIDILSGNFIFNSGNLDLNNLNAKLYNTTFYTNGKILNLFKNPTCNGELSVSKLDLKFINFIKNSEIIPKKYRQILIAYKDYEGVLSAKLKVNHDNIDGNIWLRNLYFTHSTLDYPFSVKSADFNFKNKNMDIKSFSASFADTPVFLNGNIKNITKSPNFDIYFTSKLSSNFVDNYINTNLSYPIKVNGEILLSSRITGSFNDINIYPSVKIEEGADVSYMGADLGDENSIREFRADLKLLKNKLIIKNLDYSKYINSQNNILYPLPLVNMKSQIKFIKDKVYIENFNLKTYNPISANLFNAVFKKSLVKNGKVLCDLNVKGFADNPKILGIVDLKNVQIPSFDTNIEELIMKFNQKDIDFKAKTNYLGSDIDILAKIKNNSFNIFHFNNLEIHSKKLNLDKLLNSLNEISYKRPIQIIGETNSQDTIPFDTKKLLIDKGKWTINEISFKSLPVSNFTGTLSYKNNQLKLDNVLLDIAGGKLNGSFSYNFDKALIYAKTKSEEVDANEMAYGLLDIKNQIYGKLNGSVEITTAGANDEERKQNLNGNLSFSINNGKMPKLGSIEYLLRAGNLIKSGISGLTLNNITGILLPIQNGEFETINGNMDIEKGIVKDMKVYSKGQNLSILLLGDYNINSSEADIYILGKLAKNINTILGPVGNASLNSFFNLIPGINLDENKDTDLIKQINSIPELGLTTDKFRIFRAKANGNIDADDFVTEFEWIDR